MKSINKHSILLNLDPTEGGGSVTIADPLDCNISDVNTDFPVLAKCVHSFVIDSAEVKEKEEGKKQLYISLKTTGQLNSTKGKLVETGSKFSCFVGLSETGKRTLEMVKTDLARWGKAAHVEGKLSDLVNNPNILAGKIVPINVKVNPENEQYSESNNFMPLIKD